MPKLKWPAYFDGIVGMRCTDDIKYREGFIYVPYKMIISVGKAREHPVLKDIISENPELFDQECNDNHEVLILVLMVLYEITLLQDSYYYPYLRQLPYSQAPSLWYKDDIKACQNEELIKDTLGYNDALMHLWSDFEQMLKNYPDIFASQFIDIGLFLNIYSSNYHFQNSCVFQ